MMICVPTGYAQKATLALNNLDADKPIYYMVNRLPPANLVPINQNVYGWYLERSIGTTTFAFRGNPTYSNVAGI